MEWWEQWYWPLLVGRYEWADDYPHRHQSGKQAARALIQFFNYPGEGVRRDDPRLAFPAISRSLAEGRIVKPREIGYFLVFAHVEAVIPSWHSVPPCPPARGLGRAERGVTGDYRVEEGELLEDWWSFFEDEYGLLPGTSVLTTSPAHNLHDVREVRACPEDLTTVWYTPVLDWRVVLDPRRPSCR
jgi:hypothetical protein